MGATCMAHGTCHISTTGCISSKIRQRPTCTPMNTLPSWMPLTTQPPRALVLRQSAGQVEGARRGQSGSVRQLGEGHSVLLPTCHLASASSLT